MAAGIGVSSDARRTPETMGPRPTPRRGRRAGRAANGRRGSSLFGDSTACPVVGHRPPRPVVGRGAVRRKGNVGHPASGTSAPREGLKRTGQPAAGTTPACSNQPSRGRRPVDQRPPQNLSAAAAAPKAGADGRIAEIQGWFEFQDRTRAGLFFRRPASQPCDKERPPPVCRLANGAWRADRKAVESSRRHRAAGEDSRSRPAAFLPGWAAVVARAGEKSALTHFLEWITTWAWTWNNCDRMCETAA